MNALNLCICVDIDFEKVNLEKGQPKNIPVHMQLLKNTIYLAKWLDFVLFCLKFAQKKLLNPWGRSGPYSINRRWRDPTISPLQNDEPQSWLSRGRT